MPDMLVSIADDGPGMSGEDAHKALQRGTRLDETKPGSGLGLSIVKDIAAEYSGTVTLMRSQTGGLAAQLTLPAAKAN
jgi:signal transduction histidine kinase